MSEKPELTITPSEFPAFLKSKVLSTGSVAEFAEKMDVSAKYVYMLLSGERPPSEAILKKIGDLDGMVIEVQTVYAFYRKPAAKGKK